MAPLAARAADLVLWWEQAATAEEHNAVAEVIAAFEQNTGKQVAVIFFGSDRAAAKLDAEIEAGRPPDFAFGISPGIYPPKWALEDRLADLSEPVGHYVDLFDPDALDRGMLLNATTNRRSMYGLPMGRTTYHIHVWKSLLERAGFTLEDIPKEWAAFWSFWCDEVQPAARRAMGRDDIWGVGLSMSLEAADTANGFRQFMIAYGADYVTPDGRLVIDDPEIRQALSTAIDSYTALYRKGCTPPSSIGWIGRSNNQQFLAQAVLMTLNETLSIPNVLKSASPEDYYRNTATIEWPLGPSGESFPIIGTVYSGVVFKDGDHVATAKEFVRFLVADGWLAHYLDLSGQRFLPPMQKLLDAPFWLDPSDPHQMAAVMQVASRPTAHDYTVASGDLGPTGSPTSRSGPKAIHRIVSEGVSPEQAVDEAIARIKQILSE